MRINLQDQVALVTGSARRVGKVIALELAKQGVHIVVHYNRSNPTEVQETLTELQSYGVDAIAIQADIRIPEGVEQIIQVVEQHFGRLHILVNSASAFQKRELMEVSFDDWELTMAVNVRAPFLLTQACAPLLEKNETGGTIINILDRGADAPWAEYSHHGISKAALWALTQASAVALGPKIRVNGITPGPIMKPDGDVMSDEAWEAVGKPSPLQRVGFAEDVARAVAYFASEDYLTGTAIHVNGGEHLSR